MGVQLAKYTAMSIKSTQVGECPRASSAGTAFSVVGTFILHVLTPTFFVLLFMCSPWRRQVFFTAGLVGALLQLVVFLRVIKVLTMTV